MSEPVPVAQTFSYIDDELGIAFILLSVFGSKTEGLSTKHTLYTIGSAIITIAIFISIGYAIQYLTAALYGL
ncbi:hypothetical protein APW64_12660 [Staphylococcus aureus]|nr:hypothetical protein APW64_12660 [Staphylococcus aureus]